MRPPIRLKPLRGRQLQRLQKMYDRADSPRLQRRVQMILLAHDGRDTAEIARVTRQSAATVPRWLHRFEAEGCAGLEEAPRSGRPPQVTDAVEAYLRKVVVQSPREFGYARPGWTTALLAKLIRRKYKRDVSEECVRQHLAAAGVVCRRPTWTVKYRAEELPGYAQKKAGSPGS